MYQAGIYCRISIEEQNKEGEYSNSIHSQIQMARDYIAENKDIAADNGLLAMGLLEVILKELNFGGCWQILSLVLSIW